MLFFTDSLLYGNYEVSGSKKVMLVVMRSVGVAPEVNLKVMQVTKHPRKDPPWF